MSRLTMGLALATSLLSSVAFAETQAEIAARENEEGKTLMFSAKYGEASEKFQNAVARVPEPKYFFNLCTSRFSEGKFGDALTACNAADKNGDDKLKAKTATLVAKIREEAQKQGIDLQATGGGGGPGDTPPIDPNNPGGPPVTDPNNPGGPAGPGVGQPPGGVAVGRPPDTGLFQATRPENKYTWSVGIDLFGGGGNVGRSDVYGNSGGGVRLKADYLLNPKARFGAEGYFQFTHFGQGKDQVGTGTGRNMLDIMDIGVAAYKHFCGPHARLCFTPLAGVQLALMSPSNDMDATGSQIFNYASLGFRFDGGIDYALGSRFEHVVGLHAGINLYTRAFSEPMDGSGTAAERGLDQGGRAAYVSFGYTYRFQTPFGSTPFVTLE